ncbi:hypothetical protein J010_06375 [Cryptococcus neoformans]|nr:hypothetical protein J010_06375 [Cryptococcus neoformans var. grubii]OXH23233.1 hypothetical protein J009_06357 [Cryptococcus neoformans var. grubii]OXH23390.1 hypothetical protein J005_06395 [Cryptococcus neoformans var. grubii]
MSADHTKYHVAPTGFWKKFRDTVVVNPEISSGLPIPTENRYPQPASRPETYATPATKASDPAFNPYWKRDARRSYPQTSVITQSHLSTLLLSSPALASLPSPETAVETKWESSGIAPASPPSDAQQVVPASKVPALADVLQKLPEGKAYLGGGLTTGQGEGLPPVPPPAQRNKKWVPKAGEPVPHGKYDYFPMYTVV